MPSQNAPEGGAIFVGGLVNIPVKSIVRDTDVIVHPFAVYGLADFWLQLQRVRRGRTSP